MGTNVRDMDTTINVIFTYRLEASENRHAKETSPLRTSLVIRLGSVQYKNVTGLRGYVPPRLGRTTDTTNQVRHVAQACESVRRVPRMMPQGGPGEGLSVVMLCDLRVDPILVGGGRF